MLLALMTVRPGDAQERLTVFVSILPQRFFVQQIGKDLVDVHVMVEPGASPHAYEPKPRQMAALSKTKAYFATGVEFENAWLDKIAAVNPAMKVVHLDRGIEKIAMAAHHDHNEKDTGRHEGEQDRENSQVQQTEHRHGTPDPHIWLSPPLVKRMVRTALAVMQELDPANGAAYGTNADRLLAAIDGLDAQLKGIFADRQGLRFMVFHPAWGYFARAYGLEQVPVEIEGKEPKPAQLKKLIEYARTEGIKVVFAQPQFSAKSATLIAREIGGQVAFADPLAEDWIANLRQVADKFRNALQ